MTAKTVCMHVHGPVFAHCVSPDECVESREWGLFESPKIKGMYLISDGFET